MSMTTDVSLMQMKNLIEINRANIDLDDYSKIFINLSSILNTLFYEGIKIELEDEDKLVEYSNNLKTAFKLSIMEIYRKDKEYYIYYSSQPSYNNKYEPVWDKYLNEYKFQFPMDRIYKEFLQAVIGLSNTMKNIISIDTGNVESAYFPFYHSLHHTVDKSLIISRDLMDLLNVQQGFHIFDSRTLFKDLNRHTSKKITQVPNFLFKYYLYLLGISKHSYNGIDRMGKLTSAKYLVNNIDNLENDPIFKNESFIIFDIRQNLLNNNISFKY